jgi:type II secretory pathway pseudopilin PulG
VKGQAISLGPHRRGFVLVAALVALVLIALLITGAFFASAQDVAVARAELRDQQAFAFAEYAAAHALESWDTVASERMTVGQTVILQSTPDPPLDGSVFITRLDSALFVVVAEGRVTTADAHSLRRRIGITVRSIVNGARVTPPQRVTEQAWSELY